MSQDITPAAQGGALAQRSGGVLGFGENISSSDIRLPRIELTQALSGSVQDGTHKQGTLINSLTKEALAEPVTVIPVFASKSVIKWKPRKEGGGIVYKTSNFNDPQVKEDVQWHGDEKPAATVYINIVCLVDGQPMPLVASFCNTSQKAGFNLLSMIAMTGKAWAYKYVLTPVLKENSQGKFFVLSVKMGKPTTAEEQAAAEKMFAMVSTFESIDTDYEGDTTGDAAPAAPAKPEEF